MELSERYWNSYYMFHKRTGAWSHSRLRVRRDASFSNDNCCVRGLPLNNKGYVIIGLKVNDLPRRTHFPLNWIKSLWKSRFKILHHLSLPWECWSISDVCVEFLAREPLNKLPWMFLSWGKKLGSFAQPKIYAPAWPVTYFPSFVNPVRSRDKLPPSANS